MTAEENLRKEITQLEIENANHRGELEEQDDLIAKLRGELEECQRTRDWLQKRLASTLNDIIEAVNEVISPDVIVVHFTKDEQGQMEQKVERAGQGVESP